MVERQIDEEHEKREEAEKVGWKRGEEEEEV